MHRQTGPKGEKRPADVIGAAIMVAKIATGEIEDNFEHETGKPRKFARENRLPTKTKTFAISCT